MREPEPSAPPDVDEALALIRGGRFAEAERALERRCARDAADPYAWFLLGVARHRRGRLDPALAALERAAAIAPDRVPIAGARAAVLADLGRAPAALAVLEAALEHAPHDAALLTNAGVLCEDLGRDAEALRHYERATACAPDHADAWLNRGALLARTGRHAPALESTERALALDPARAAGHFNRADVLLALRRFDEALESSERALALDASHARAHVARGLALAALGRLEEARAALDAATALDAQVVRAWRNPLAPQGRQGEAIDPRLVYLHLEWERQQRCDWRDRARYLERFERLVLDARGTEAEIRDRALAFPALALGVAPPAQLALARSVSAEVARNAAAMRVRFHHARERSGRLRVGYLSPNFRRHPSAYLTSRLYELHDRDAVEVHAYSLHPDDGSEQRRRIERGCDRFRELSGATDVQAARRIHADGIHVLVDLAGYGLHSRAEILALRPAPVQVGYLGHPASSGAAFIDYRVTDAVASPPGQDASWSEALVRLPESHYPYDDRDAGSRAPSRAACGLPEDGFVFCCFSNGYKIEPVVFDIWMRLLARVPDSVLWLLARDEATAHELRREATARGVDAARLVFAPVVDHASHVARHGAADLFLDTIACGAHATACDALAAGLPVLTLAGETLATRIGASVVRAAGTPELVVDSPAAYEAGAAHLASDPEALAALRARLRAARATCPLFDVERTVRHLETAYRAMWERHAAGEPPDAIAVPSADTGAGF